MTFNCVKANEWQDIEKVLVSIEFLYVTESGARMTRIFVESNDEQATT